MKSRALCIAVLAAIAPIVFAPAVWADPAVELPSQACNQGTDRASGTANPNSNTPVPPHNIHGCHVHLP